MRVLVTRPEPDASRTAAKLERRGHEVVLDPLLALEILPVPGLPAGPFAALAVTSANAMRALAALSLPETLRGLPLFAVGRHSAEAARAAGFTQVQDADGDAAALAWLIAQTLPPGARLLHLAGEERARDLGTLLAPARIEVTLLVLYRMRAADSFGPAAAALEAGALDAVLHYSPRSAAAFAALAGRAGLAEAARGPRHLCISAAAAAPLAALGARVEIAAAPNEESLAQLLDS